MPKKETATILSIDGREVRVSNPDKPYFSGEVKLSKLDVVRYYLSVSDGAVAGIRDRPSMLKRFVDGAESPPFYQKRAPDNRPDWLRTVTLSFPSGRTAEEVVVDDAAGLAWIVKEVQDGIWNVIYYETLLGRFDERTRTITGAPSLKKGC